MDKSLTRLKNKSMQIIKIILALPKTIWFNIHYLPLRQAIHLPIWIAPNCKIKIRGGKMQGFWFCLSKNRFS